MVNLRYRISLCLTLLSGRYYCGHKTVGSKLVRRYIRWSIWNIPFKFRQGERR